MVYLWMYLSMLFASIFKYSHSYIFNFSLVTFRSYNFISIRFVFCVVWHLVFMSSKCKWMRFYKYLTFINTFFMKKFWCSFYSDKILRIWFSIWFYGISNLKNIFNTVTMVKAALFLHIRLTVISFPCYFTLALASFV